MKKKTTTIVGAVVAAVACDDDGVAPGHVDADAFAAVDRSGWKGWHLHAVAATTRVHRRPGCHCCYRCCRYECQTADNAAHASAGGVGGRRRRGGTCPSVLRQWQWQWY